MSTKEKRIVSRSIQKHDLEVNWIKATGFIPYKGELIIYDIEVDKDGNTLELPTDEIYGRTTPYTYERIKIGDGIHTVSDLPFIDTALRNEIIETYATKAEVAEINTEAIIDVASFPIEDIKEDSFYRVTTGTFYINNNINAMMVCHIIDELPETGLPTFDYSGSSTDEHLYYRASDDTLWTYMSEEFLQFQQGNPFIEGCAVGWHRAEPFFAKNDCVYNGTYTDFSAVPSTGYSLVLSQKDLYQYKNGWHKLKFMQTDPDDDTAEIFNNPGNKAVGSYTHAEGSGTYAIGGGSHAEGWNTYAGSTSMQAAAHAEGYATSASGLYSHAEGNGTVAYYTAHAEGQYTDATGSYSHAEGNGTTASGSASHAEGDSTTASGLTSHAEGFHSKASGKYAHSEGQQTTASGQSTHAEGALTTAVGIYSHAEGYYTTTFGEASHAEGRSTNTYSNAGVTNSNNNDNILSKWSSKPFSLAKGANSHIEGLDSLALGAQAHAEGAGTHAIGDNSHAEGFAAAASGSDSHAEGHQTVASGNFSHAEGNTSTASGECSHAEGQAYASGNYSHAEGYTTQAIGLRAHAEGYTTQAIGLNAHSEGDNTIANGPSSHVEGSKTTTSNIAVASHAEGLETSTSAMAAHAEGYATSASGLYSHAEGYYTAASGTAQHVQGRRNIPDTESQYAHIVGNGFETNVDGSNNITYSNAHTLDWNGNAWFQGEIKLGGTGQDDPVAKTVATIDEFDDEWLEDAIFVFDKTTKKFKYSGKTLSGFKKEIQDEMKSYIADYIETYMSTEIEVNDDSTSLYTEGKTKEVMTEDGNLWLYVGGTNE
jgi:hypothetical protein